MNKSKIISKLDSIVTPVMEAHCGGSRLTLYNRFLEELKSEGEEFSIVRTNEMPYYKTVSAYGMILPVHAEVNFIAVDSVGQMFSFREMPILDDNNINGWKSSDGWFALITTVEFDGDWKKSLVCVEENL